MDNLNRPSDVEETLSTLQSVAQRLAYTTQCVQDDPIIQVVTPEDVPNLVSIGTPGSPHAVEDVIEEAFTVFDNRMRVNHPRFFGLIPSPTSPYAWLGDCIASAFNALGASKLQASGPVVVEKTLVAWLAQRVGLPSGTAGGVFVSGGSMANLMGLAMARDHRLPRGEESRGVAYLSDQTHYSVAKALRLIGFRKDQVRTVPSNDSFQMDVEALEKAISEDRAAGLLPFLVVGTCGTTNTGAIDPLDAIARICTTENLWLHVDGAYGASAALSSSRSHFVRGLRHADSASWDAHKWLFQTYSCGLILVKDKKHMIETFANDGDYLRDGVAIEDEDVPNFWNYSMELTRPSSRAMKLWFTLRVLGVEKIGEMLDHGFLLAERAEEELRARKGWEITSPASLGIVTFRYAPEGRTEAEREQLNADISKRLVATNTAGILTTKLRGKVALRICALNPNLPVGEMGRIVEEMDGFANEANLSLN